MSFAEKTALLEKSINHLMENDIEYSPHIIRVLKAHRENLRDRVLLPMALGSDRGSEAFDIMMESNLFSEDEKNFFLFSLDEKIWRSSKLEEKVKEFLEETRNED
jgi:hypothetical protein